MQIDELDDQQHRHLHRSGAPQREGSKYILASKKPLPSTLVLNLHKLYSDWTNRLEQRAKGTGAHLLTAGSGRPVKGSCKIRALRII
uniref:Uncharacterized protein n=1 Tax=Romanomermis culicivorax TaxID=13658 RepID=A0A915J5Q3_ROMCU